MSFDLDLYMYAGKWYNIARTPNPWQSNKGCAMSYVNYYVDDYGRGEGRMPSLDIVNHCYNTVGEETKISRAHAKVSTIPNVLLTRWEDYPDHQDEMLIFDTDYTTYAIEGSLPKDSNKPYLWIMSREPSICQHKLDQIYEKIEQMHLDTSDIITLPNTIIPCEYNDAMPFKRYPHIVR